MSVFCPGFIAVESLPLRSVIGFDVCDLHGGKSRFFCLFEPLNGSQQG
jgi:hypothetical protein